MDDSLIRKLERELSREVWLPPIVHPDGTVDNIVQGRMVYHGASKGETNYKTRKRPTKFGRYKTEQGTFVANNHFERQIIGQEHVGKSGKKFIKPSRDGLLADGDGSIRIIKLGRIVKVKNGLGWDKQFAKAGQRAIDKITSHSCKFQAAGDSRTGADMVKSPALQANVFAAEGGTALP